MTNIPWLLLPCLKCLLVAVSIIQFNPIPSNPLPSPPLEGWTESSAYQLLQESAHRTLCVAVAAKDHGYCSGAQHQRKDRYLEAPYDTIVFILQNEQGRRVHSASTSTPSGAAKFEEELRAAFSTAIPTEAMKQRRLKEGRGFGDLDGGGGVYKGKKQNKKSS